MPGIYIHIPFCKQACHYCNFYFSTSKKHRAGFIDALLREIDLQKDFLWDWDVNVNRSRTNNLSAPFVFQHTIASRISEASRTG
jgi:hypothetical protein